MRKLFEFTEEEYYDFMEELDVLRQAALFLYHESIDKSICDSAEERTLLELSEKLT